MSSVTTLEPAYGHGLGVDRIVDTKTVTDDEPKGVWLDEEYVF